MITHLFNQGRLGNQMFQIASTIGIAKKLGFGYIFPKWHFANKFKNQIPQVPHGTPYHTTTYFQGNSVHYHEVNVGDDTALNGYYQTEKYFTDYSSEIKELFTPSQEVLNKASKYDQVFKDNDTVSIHIRRGDYIKCGWFPGLDYYKEAIKLFPSTFMFLVFSDDPDWCKANLKIKNCLYILEDEVTSIHLMGKCDHNIISNSSFSWWGAWLGETKGKRIIYPNYQSGDFPNKDFYPERWIKLC